MNPDTQPTLDEYSVTVYYLNYGNIEESVYCVFAVSQTAVIDAMRRIYGNSIIQSIIFN